MKGFTLAEVLIVIIIVAIILVLVLPLGVGFYRTQQLDTTVEEVIQALRRAQSNAMAVDGDVTWGVYFTSGQYSLFKGASYATRTDEEVFDTLDDIAFGGISEIVFTKLTGLPDSTGNITLTLDAEVETISINSVGRINYE